MLDANAQRDYSILIEGRKLDYLSIERYIDNRRKDQAEFGFYSEKLQNDMNAFQNLDIMECDVPDIKEVEAKERKEVVAYLQKCGGDPASFYRGGGKGVINKYIENVKKSEAYVRAIQTGHSLKVAVTALEKGETPNMVNINSGSRPEYLPFWEAFNLYEKGLLKNEWGVKIPLPYNGSFRNVELFDLQPSVAKIIPDNRKSRQVRPEEIRNILELMKIPEWRIVELVSEYESKYYKKDVSTHSFNILNTCCN